MTFHLLFVCTANQCRSPMAERLAALQLKDLGVPCTVASVGSMRGGVNASDGAVAALRKMGLDLSDHTSTTLDLSHLLSADLVLTMERRHLHCIADIDIGSLERSFPLKELVELAPIVGPRSSHIPLSQWISKANSFRSSETVLSFGTDSDVKDPMGGTKRAYRRTAIELDTLLSRLFTFMFPDRRSNLQNN